MEFGAHLPLISFAGERRSLDDLLAFADAARDLGYTHLCTNDHLVFARPWLDGLTALAAVLPRSGGMTLATTIVVPVLRGPIATAKILAALDVLSGGRLVVGVGPGSSARDYELAGVPFDERWKRLDESVRVLRACWRGARFDGTFYSIPDVAMEPLPVQRPGPPILDRQLGVGSGVATGGPARRRLARLRLQHDARAVRNGVARRARERVSRRA